LGSKQNSDKQYLYVVEIRFPCSFNSVVFTSHIQAVNGTQGTYAWIVH
jgi:hypothetical protein